MSPQPSKYQMKDLGHKRTPTDAMLHVTMPDGSVWRVPVQIIADNRDEHYATDKEDTVGFIKAKKLNKCEIEAWSANNMNWADVCAFAEQVRAPDPVNFEEGWAYGRTEIVGEL